jgi:hypothetical protein
MFKDGINVNGVRKRMYRLAEEHEVQVMRDVPSLCFIGDDLAICAFFSDLPWYALRLCTHRHSTLSADMQTWKQRCVVSIAELGINWSIVCLFMQLALVLN